MSIREEARQEAEHHYVQLIVESGELHRAFVCTAPEDADCRRRPEGFEERMRESWTAEEATKSGYPCWAKDWVEAVGIEDAIYASPEGVLASVPVQISYSEGVEITAIEQADRESGERLMVAPAIQAVRDVLDVLEDWEIQDHALEEIRSAVDDIPDCESATAIPHEEHREPSDAERMAAARAINLAGWTCYGGADEPGQFDTCEDCQRVCLVVADAALLAAQEVRRG